MLSPDQTGHHLLPICKLKCYDFWFSAEVHPSCANIGIFGWWLGLAATSNFVASMILAIVSLWCSEYVPDSFHTWMIYIAVVWSAVFLNTFGSRLVPSFNKMMRELCHSVDVAQGLTTLRSSLLLDMLSLRHYCRPSCICLARTCVVQERSHGCKEQDRMVGQLRIDLVHVKCYIRLPRLRRWSADV